MHWADVVVSVALVGSLAGLWILRDRSDREPNRIVSDRQVRAILSALSARANEPSTSVDLEQRTGIALPSLQPMLVTLVLRQLLERVALDGSNPPRQLYRLTDRGVVEAQLRGGDCARGRHRT